MDQQLEALERLLDEELRRATMRHAGRYEVRRLGADWAIIDCVQDRPNGRVVRVTKWRALALTVVLAGNVWGPCQQSGCDEPACVLVYGRELCAVHLPEGEIYGLVCLASVRMWRAAQGE